jgi:hypothetical protein
LASHGLRIKNKLNRIRSCEQEVHFYKEEDLERSIDGVDQARDIADVNNELKPFKILGLPAQAALTMSVLSAAIAFYTIVFSLYDSGTTNAYSDFTQAGL